MMATYNDFFNVDSKIESSTKLNKETKILKNEILKSVKSVIEDDKNKVKNKKNY